MNEGREHPYYTGLHLAPNIPDTWTLANEPLFQTCPPQLHMRIKVLDWCYVNVVTQASVQGQLNSDQSALSNRDTRGDLDFEAVRQEFLDSVDQILELCRHKYSSSVPGFGITLQLQPTSKGYEIVEHTCPDLLASLYNADALLGDLKSLVSFVPKSSLQALPAPGLYFPPNTRLVLYNGKRYVAKGPIYPSRAGEDFLDAINLLELSEGHPNIIPPPKTFVTASDGDDRICGFLMPFYPNGTLDVHASRLRGAAALSEEHLLRWFRQLVNAVAHLAKLGTWHGDLKPDNILVSEEEDIVLIDFTRIFATFATASPEVRQHCVSQKATGIPSEWPLESVIQSEVYSIGRTMYLVCEGMSMMELYRNYGWMNPAFDFPTVFAGDSLTPHLLREIILLCVSEDPRERPTLGELSRMLQGNE